MSDLAGACATGNTAALQAFDERFLSQLPMLLSRMNPPAAFVDEMRQVLREMLRTAQPGRSPKIAEYSGRGSLTSGCRGPIC
jgi:RNA polymerase sigma-70 factor (ECF subfamily)